MARRTPERTPRRSTGSTGSRTSGRTGITRSRTNARQTPTPARTLTTATFGTVDLDAFDSAITGGKPFRAKAALECGVLTRHALSTRFRLVHPGVYIAADAQPDTRDLIRAVHLWAPPDAVIAGWGAAKLHREKWYADRRCAVAVDLYSPRRLRSTPGVRVHVTARMPKAPDLSVVDGMIATSPARTAVDVGRWTRGVDERICAIDAVCNGSRTGLDAVAGAAGRMVGQHGVKTVINLLASCDIGADSPQETMVRLWLERSDLPAPATQVVIVNRYGQKIATADLAYEKVKVAVFYDGEVHRSAEQSLFDDHVDAELRDMGWEVIRVVAGMLPKVVVNRIERAYDRNLLRYHL
ncbi:hypothetical protein M3C36_11195 [Dietzia cinnamea]|uniref:hypothetical protein n=1 Tax=Dietzia cinnamea TaxID=321318 RepID=UPI0021A6B7C2|nr:hypothetical protein [Dietzia cinnamea]MCT1885742.1 hypothetical protein [Dietzia cinnamea]